VFQNYFSSCIYNYTTMLIFLSRNHIAELPIACWKPGGLKFVAASFICYLSYFFSTTLSFAPWFTLSCFSNMVKLVIEFMLVMYCWTTGRRRDLACGFLRERGAYLLSESCSVFLCKILEAMEIWRKNQRSLGERESWGDWVEMFTPGLLLS
jgi:hypothetical protein